jgi:hypothetical protein
MEFGDAAPKRGRVEAGEAKRKQLYRFLLYKLLGFLLSHNSKKSFGIFLLETGKSANGTGKDVNMRFWGRVCPT